MTTNPLSNAVADSQARTFGLGMTLGRSFCRALLTALLLLAVAPALPGQTVLYQTGFEAPGFVTGNLAGQGGWASSVSASQNAARVIAAAGGQEVQISGPSVALCAPSYYDATFYRSLGNYNPVASGTPIVDVSADLWQQQGPTTSRSSWQFAFLILSDQNGTAYGCIGIDQYGAVFGQNWAATNQVVGDGSSATNGFHTVKMELNFAARTITCFKDGFTIGTMSFNTTSSNQLGSVSLVLQGGSPIDSSLFVDNLSVTAGSTVSTSSCELQITGAGPWSNTDNGAPGPPQVGNVYELYVTFNVRGQPTNAFRIKWTMANVTNYFDNINVGPGTGYVWYFTWWVSLDDPIPWSVTLDPDNVTGNTNLVSNTASGTFTPVPPTNAVELYSSRMMHGWESNSLSFQPGSGTIGSLEIFFGVPTTHGAQQAFSVTPPANAQSLVTAPYGLPLFEIARTNVPAGTFQDQDSFVVQLSNMRVNPTLLRAATWAEMTSLGTNWTQWLAPDPVCESTNAEVLAFVQQSLPNNYQSVLTPYDTARALHLAVMKKLTYQSPPFHGDAVGVLQDGVADCGGFSSLLTACLRAVGIPARTMCGFWQGTGQGQWHVRVEFHLPGADWLVADPTTGNADDPTGTYAYDFAYVPDAIYYLAVDVGNSHLLLGGDWGGIQVPNWWWSGGATYNSGGAVSYLQPNGVLATTNSTPGTLALCLSDTPAAGSIVLQTSTNLTAWSPVATNAANGNAINYSFPNTNAPRRFYRVQVIP
jgi:transglutaminase-like putative cysteine protease